MACRILLIQQGSGFMADSLRANLEKAGFVTVLAEPDVKSIEKAKEEISQGEMSGPCVSAIVNSTKELNTIFGVAEKAEGGGVLEDILNAVRGVDND